MMTEEFPGGGRVYKMEDGCYAISQHQMWLPGVYADKSTAIRAFSLPDGRLRAIMAAANERAGGAGGTITADDLDKETAAP